MVLLLAMVLAMALALVLVRVVALVCLRACGLSRRIPERLRAIHGGRRSGQLPGWVVGASTPDDHHPPPITHQKNTGWGVGDIGWCWVVRGGWWL